MKKRVSFPVRIMSLILTFLLLFTTIAGMGITTASAKTYSGISANIYKLQPGDSVEKGVKLYKKSFFEISFINIYFDGVLSNGNSNNHKMQRRGIFVELKERGRIVDVYFKTNQPNDENIDETLAENLKQNETVTLTEDVVLKKSLNISDGKNHIINTDGYNMSLDENANNSLFVVENGSSLTVNGLSEGGERASLFFSGGSNYDGGVARVLEKSNLVLNNLDIDTIKAKNGGAVYVNGGSVYMNDCTVENCTASGSGGALYVDQNATADLTNCRFERNSASDGGGIANLGTLKLTDCTIRCNRVKGGGGGIWSNGDAKLTNTNVNNNYNAINGGGVTNHKNMTISGCTIESNGVSNWAGGLFIDSNGSTVINNGTVIRNNSSLAGAGINFRKGKASITDTSILNNSARGSAGGGIWANTGTELTLKNVKVQGNSCATNGGGINSHGTLSLVNCPIDSNSADNCGGGVYMDTSSTLTVDNSTITFCQAKVAGGGIYFHAGSLILAGGKIRITDSNTNGKSSNLCQREFNNIQVTGRLASGSDIGFQPPANSANRNVTTGFGQNNTVAPAMYFHCDTNEFKVNREEGIKEVNLIQGLRGTKTSYKIRIDIAVTDDADLWDYAYFHIYGRGNKGKGSQVHLNSSPDFKTSIDEDGKSYRYEYDCGADNFPTAVNFVTKFGFAGQRDFEGDIKIYINEINVVNTHAKHVVWECQEKNTWIDITGDKYPCPEPDDFEVDAPKGDVEGSAVITVSAVDQYGLIWKADGANTSMKNISFPKEDTFSMLDNTGFKWKLSSNHSTNHWSTYQLVFKSGSNVYPEITKSITVRFVFPQHVRVVVDGKEVFDKIVVKEKETVQIRGIESIPGYYIGGYEKDGTGELVQIGTNPADVDITPINQSVTLTANLKANYYKLNYDANGTPNEKGKYIDIRNSMRKRTLHYDEPQPLDNVKFMRSGYTFVGWNTQKDGKGTMYKNMDTVVNLSSEKGVDIYLYAIWKPDNGSTTASIFSDGTALIYVGAGILILSIVAAVIYSKRKKREGAQAANQ